MGGVVLVVTPVAAVSLVVTLLALPVGVILLALYGVTVYLARIYTMTWAGQWLLRHKDESTSLARAFTVGLVVYSLLSGAGGRRSDRWARCFFGLGALLMAKKELIAGLQEQQQV